MTALSKTQYKADKPTNSKDSLLNTVKILTDITREDIEKSYNIGTSEGTEAYYSNRYGWTLRKIVEWLNYNSRKKIISVNDNYIRSVYECWASN